MVSTTTGAAPPQREPPRPPPPAVIEAEMQWIFTEEELLLAPSIADGMPAEEERTLRRKGVGFILQVGMMLKLPQTTLSTAAVFFNRYLMRMSLKPRPGYKPLHHYQIAATALFLATKVEENCRKMKELVVSCVRVALKDPNKLVDEQTKDFWKWRDTILYSEDVLLEALCFDLNVESPYKTMYDMMKYYGVEHNKKLRNSAWAFLSDSTSTQMCLLFTSRTIAAASLYAGARMAEVELSDDEGKPWWEIQHVQLRDIRRACNLMADLYEKTPDKDGEPNMYAGLRTPEDGIDFGDTPRSMEGVQMTGQSQPPANGTGDGNATERGSEEGELDGQQSTEQSSANSSAEEPGQDEQGHSSGEESPEQSDEEVEQDMYQHGHSSESPEQSPGGSSAEELQDPNQHYSLSPGESTEQSPEESEQDVYQHSLSSSRESTESPGESSTEAEQHVYPYSGQASTEQSPQDDSSFGEDMTNVVSHDDLSAENSSRDLPDSSGLMSDNETSEELNSGPDESSSSIVEVD